MQLTLIGIGTGNPEHLTLQAIRAINAQEVILIPQKGPSKSDLADLRQTLCETVLTNAKTRVIGFDLPTRDDTTQNYLQRVDDWHDAIAVAWQSALPKGAEKVALLVWGDPSLYDSTLRIAARLTPPPEVSVIPGLTSIQLLTAAHAMPINEIGAPFLVTTGRRLRAEGWPVGVDTLVVMLDADCAFNTLSEEDVHIWWGAYLGMAEEITCAGYLRDVADNIADMRARARAAHGWIMDIYILRRGV
ncbi:MAG: precorrin-6A synthase (deacetylating) [Pseudomonadota bacterium]